MGAYPKVLLPTIAGVSWCLVTLAAHKGHNQLLPCLLQAGLNIEGGGTADRTPLMEAAAMGHNRTVEALLTLGANPLVTDSTGRTALYLAALHGHQQCVAVLMPVFSPIPEHLEAPTPVHAASFHGHVEVLEQLADVGWPITGMIRYGTPLHHAVAGGSMAAVQWLVQRGADPHVQDVDGDTALDWAVTYGRHEVETWLAKNGGEMVRDESHRVIDVREWRRIHEDNHNEVLSWLVAGNEADIARIPEYSDGHVLSMEGLTPLHAAALFGASSGVVEALLQRGVNPHVITPDNMTPADLARQRGHIAVIKGLQWHHCEQDDTPPEHLHEELLTTISRGDDVQAVSSLLCKGAPMEPLGGRSALRLAVTNDRARTVSLLLARGASLSASLLQEAWQSPSVTTTVLATLTTAYCCRLRAELRRLGKVSRAFFNGIKNLLKVIEGNSPWQAAWRWGKDTDRAALSDLLTKAAAANCPVTAAFLQRAGAWPFFSRTLGGSALHAALEAGHQGMVEVLTRDLGGSPYVPDTHGRLAVHMMTDEERRKLDQKVFEMERTKLENLELRQKGDRDKMEHHSCVNLLAFVIWISMPNMLESFTATVNAVERVAEWQKVIVVESARKTRQVGMEAATRREEEAKMVASFFSSLFVDGSLSSCLPVLLAAEGYHILLQSVSHVIITTHLSYHLESFLLTSPPLRSPAPPPGRSPYSSGTYCVAYCLLAPLPIVGIAVEDIPRADWFPGATRFFVIYSGQGVSERELRQVPALLNAYNTLYLVHAAPSALDLHATCPFCHGGKATVVQRNTWQPGKGLHLSSETLFPDVFQDLNGRRFRAVTLSFPPFSHYVSGSYKEPLDMQDCLDKRIVDAISETYNFSYQVFEPADGKWGYEVSPGNFTGVLGEVQHRLADFSLDLSIVAEREVVIDFSIGYLLEPLTFVTSKPRPLPQWQAVVRPFGGWVWISLGVALLLSGPLLWLLLRLSFSHLSMPDAVFLTFAALVCQSRPWPSSPHVRVFIATWLLFCLVATVSFVGNLTAFLTVPAYSTTLETLEDLVRSDFTWGINDFGAADYQLFKTSEVPLYQEIFKGLTFCPSLVACIQKALDENFAFISFSTYLRDAVAMHFVDRNGDTQVHMARDRFFPADTGFALQKGSPLKRLFDRVLRRLLEAGLVDKWLNDLIQQHTLATRRKAAAAARKGRSGGAEALQEGLTLTTYHLQGVFLVCGAGLLFSTLTFVCELMVYSVLESRPCCANNLKWLTCFGES
ncbi:uncharacterized protein LOC135097467 isoform X4 [Scylla paramamosain]